jgi:3-dehydroquinate dehydratase
VRAGLARALEDLRTKLAQYPKLLTIVQVDSDTSAATVTFFPGALGHATIAIVDATVSITVVRSKRSS